MTRARQSWNAELIRHYDECMHSPLMGRCLAHSDFHNFGFWDKDTGNHREAGEKLLEKLLAFVPDKTGKVLDVACGTGGTTRYLSRYYRPEDITAINVSEKQLETARGNAPGCTFLWMDATRLQFEDESFDSIICVEAAFHFNTREQFLRQSYRVLRPGGWLVLSDTLMPREAERRRAGRWEANYLPGPQAYRSLLSRVGFREASVVDATEQCWRRFYRNMVQRLHAALLAKEIEVADLKALLKHTYALVPDLEYYLLAAGRKVGRKRSPGR